MEELPIALKLLGSRIPALKRILCLAQNTMKKDIWMS